jgi:ADP-ribosyl-[dinitrogen reductase] hydrolase
MNVTGTHKDMYRRQRIRNAIVFALVGDAMGVPYEFRRREMMDKRPAIDMTGYGTHEQPPGTWSDDGALILATMDSLIAKNGNLDWEDIGDMFVKWRDRSWFTATGHVFDIGMTTCQAIDRLKAKQKHPVKCGDTNPDGQANGSLMRILPMALYVASAMEDNPMGGLPIIAHASSLTHGSETCVMACQFYYLAVHSMLHTRSSIEYARRFAAHHMGPLMDSSRNPKIWDRVRDDGLLKLDRSEISGSGWVIACLEAAFWCGGRAKTPAGGLLEAVNLGDDTDTTACVTGGLLGMQFDCRTDIPNRWRTMIEDHPEMPVDLFRFVNLIERGRC